MVAEESETCLPRASKKENQPTDLVKVHVRGAIDDSVGWMGHLFEVQGMRKKRPKQLNRTFTVKPTCSLRQIEYISRKALNEAVGSVAGIREEHSMHFSLPTANGLIDLQPSLDESVATLARKQLEAPPTSSSPPESSHSSDSTASLDEHVNLHLNITIGSLDASKVSDVMGLVFLVLLCGVGFWYRCVVWKARQDEKRDVKGDGE
eukprot:GHVN01026679.1.p1 GENE.GHVN01026679.1~~GHVN01026679.1.p1  ORF type:complete len:206 (+),score=50.10 GHVN01026679.1:75-692(+)